jgi:hypothetical protein
MADAVSMPALADDRLGGQAARPGQRRGGGRGDGQRGRGREVTP